MTFSAAINNCRYHEKNYTRSDIKNDLKVIQVAGLSKDGIFSILHAATWAWTENRDIFDKAKKDTVSKQAKFKGCIYWTENAFKSKENLLKNGAPGKDVASDLRHEHIVPQKVFKDAIEKYYNEGTLSKNLQIIQTAMEENLIGCVVTTNEADLLDKKPNRYRQTMPPPYDPDKCDLCKIKDHWARYKYTKNDKHINALGTFSNNIYELEWSAPNTKKGCWKFVKIKQIIPL